MGKGYRQGRLSQEIKKLISEMLVRELKDPRLDGMISISDVSVTSDGSYATIYVTCFKAGASEEEKREYEISVIEAFESSKGLIKKEIGNNIKLRHVPQLIFKIDASFENGMHIESLIKDMKK